MKHARKFIPMIGAGVVTAGLLGLTGCDYWPPALRSQIESLRTELNDALDDRQRLDRDLTELSAAHAALQRELEEKRRENDSLQQRLAARPGTRTATAVAHRSGQAAARTLGTMSSVRRGSYVSLQLEHPYRRGSQVARLQRLLRRHDFPIRIDGIYGRDTDAAVRSFQRVHGLPIDGVVGPATYRTLRATGPVARLARHLSLRRPPLAGQDVSRVQQALRRAGYRIAVDGRFGPETRHAVIRFQRKHRLAADGMVGPRTWSALKNRP